MIHFQQVTKRYGDRPVVDGVDLSIREGEFFVLVGPSGSGKTTLLKMINGLIERTEGEILIQNRPIGSYPLRELRLDVGYVLQQIALFPNLTVCENITLIPEMKGWPREQRLKKARELLEKVGLDPKVYMKRKPRDLSGGEQQRVGILRAIIAGPKILLMDEPFSALDPLAREQLQDLVLDLHRELKMTMVFVTHDLNEALKLGDRIGVLRGGKLIQVDSPENIVENPENAFISDFFQGR
ncbi:MAG: ABC transporter ATP-binding protein [Tissierellia bacterium]|nr:ABC transporter ATP-binding protein [Tissierellia bacterium]